MSAQVIEVQNYKIDGYEIQVGLTDEGHYEAFVRKDGANHILRTDLQGNTLSFFSLGAPRDEDCSSLAPLFPSNSCRRAMAKAVEQTVAMASNGKIPADK